MAVLASSLTSPTPPSPSPPQPQTPPILLRRLGWYSAHMGSSFEAHVGAAPPVGAHPQGLRPGCSLSQSLSLSLSLSLPSVSVSASASASASSMPSLSACRLVGQHSPSPAHAVSQPFSQSGKQTIHLLTNSPTHAPTPWSAGAHTALHRHERRRRRTPLRRAQQWLLQGLQLQVWHVPRCNDSGAGKWRRGAAARRRCACVMCQILDR